MGKDAALILEAQRKAQGPTLKQKETRIDRFGNNLVQQFSSGSSVLSFARTVNLIKQKLTFQLYEDENTPSRTFPRVTMRVNPANLTIRRAKKVSLDYTYGGFIPRHWHDDVIDISASGLIGSFQDKEREKADAFRRFMEIVRVFKNCGKVLDNPDLEAVAAGWPMGAPGVSSQTQAADAVVRREDFRQGRTSYRIVAGLKSHPFVEMGFGHERFRGVFDSLDMTYDEKEPLSIKYSLKFLAYEERDVGFDILDAALEAVDLYENVKTLF